MVYPKSVKIFSVNMICYIRNVFWSKCLFMRASLVVLLYQLSN